MARASGLRAGPCVMGCNTFCSALLAVVFPPCGVFCATGCSYDLIINILLTILGWIPGVLHAFYVLGSASAKETRRTNQPRHLERGDLNDARHQHRGYQTLPGNGSGASVMNSVAMGYPEDGPPPSGAKPLLASKPDSESSRSVPSAPRQPKKGDDNFV